MKNYKRNHISDDGDDICPNNENKKMKIKFKNKNKSKEKKHPKITKNNNSEVDNYSNEKTENVDNIDIDIESYKDCIYVYTDNNNNKYLYTYQKVTSDKKTYELRYKDRLNCKGRAKYNIEEKAIIVTQICSIEYENHNYIKNEIIRKKLEIKKLIQKK